MFDQAGKLQWLEPNYNAWKEHSSSDLFIGQSPLGLNSNLFIEWIPSKITATPVPIVTLQDQTMALHSRYDPEQEAARMIDGLSPAAFLIVLGFGAGYFVEALLARMDKDFSIERVLVIEVFPEIFSGVMATRNLSGILADRRISIGFAKSVSEINQIIGKHYFPHFFRSLGVVLPPPQMGLARLQGLDPEKWIHKAINSIQGDFLTQSKFGKRWLYNIVCNSHIGLKISTSTIPTTDECIIIGAGPSLEGQVKVIRSLQDKNIPTIVCDAALGYCHLNQLRVDYVMSIDGQTITYLHLLSAGMEEPKIGGVCILDFCSHPLYGRLSANPAMMGSAHPLITWLNLYGANIPYLDCSSGNVGGSMVALALEMGFGSLHVFGLDFAYLNGNPYVRPSFFHDDAGHKTSRVLPIEQIMTSQYLDDSLESKQSKNGVQQTTARLRSYRDSFHSRIAESQALITGYSTGEAIVLNPGRGAKKNSQPGSHQLDSPELSVFGALQIYAEELAKPEFGESDPLDIWETGKTAEKQLLMTLMPLMAWEQAILLKSPQESTDIRKKSFRLALKHARGLLSRFFS